MPKQKKYKCLLERGLTYAFINPFDTNFRFVEETIFNNNIFLKL